MGPPLRPERTEAAEYYFKYIDIVPGGDIRTLLEAQLTEMTTLLGEIPAGRVDFRLPRPGCPGRGVSSSDTP